MFIYRFLAGFLALMFTCLGLALPFYPFVPGDLPHEAADPTWGKIIVCVLGGLASFAFGAGLWIWAWKSALPKKDQ